jgi:thiol-disulfide isomerase/thioredoxin
LDPDVEIRTRALGMLTSLDRPDHLAAVAWQLGDPDPELRRLGLQTLRRVGSLAQVPLVLSALADPDATVALSADAVLRSWSGRDSGLRMSRVLPDRSSLLATPVAPDDLAAIAQAVVGWRDWWAAAEKPMGIVGQLAAPPPAVRSPCPKIRLPDLKGQAVDVSSFRGKRILLNFWTTWCPACLVELPLLAELQRRHPDDLVVLGISLDSPDQGALAEVPSGLSATTPTDEKRVRKIIAAVAGRHRLNYPVLLDPQNAVGRQFNGGELPTNVLLDRDGFVRRRFVGERSVAVWEALLREADRPVVAVRP